MEPDDDEKECKERKYVQFQLRNLSVRFIEHDAVEKLKKEIEKDNLEDQEKKEEESEIAGEISRENIVMAENEEKKQVEEKTKESAGEDNVEKTRNEHFQVAEVKERPHRRRRKKIPKNLLNKMSEQQLNQHQKVSIPKKFLKEVSKKPTQINNKRNLKRVKTQGMLGIRSHDEEFEVGFVGYVNNLNTTQSTEKEFHKHHELSHSSEATLQKMGDLFEIIHAHNPSMLRDVLKTFYEERNTVTKMSQPGVKNSSIHSERESTRESIDKMARKEDPESINETKEEVENEDKHEEQRPEIFEAAEDAEMDEEAIIMKEINELGDAEEVDDAELDGGKHTALHVNTIKDITDRKDTRGETLRLINKFEHSKAEFDEEVKHELEDDPNLWLLSPSAQEKLKKPADVAQILYHLERSISLIDKYIPQCNELLQNEEETQLYFTAVIQELLKRAAHRGYLKGVQQNWDRWKGVDLKNFVSEDVEKLVEYMAWVRNNIRASNVTDYNDAQMAQMGAVDIKESLKQILKDQEKKNAGEN